MRMRRRVRTQIAGILIATGTHERTAIIAAPPQLSYASTDLCRTLCRVLVELSPFNIICHSLVIKTPAWNLGRINPADEQKRPSFVYSGMQRKGGIAPAYKQCDIVLCVGFCGRLMESLGTMS